MATAREPKQSLPGTEVIYSFHPSKSFSYHPTDSCMRNELFQKIHNTCKMVSGHSDKNIWDHQFGNGQHAFPRTVDASKIVPQSLISCVKSFLETIVCLCLGPDELFVADLNICPGQDLYSHTVSKNCPPWIKENVAAQQAMGLLEPVILDLNRCYQRVS
jgi:hypothetical protein